MTVLHSLYAGLIAPFVAYDFMARALVATLALAAGCGPVGVLLVLRRMSLVGDAMSHAILPGAAVGFLIGGLSLPAMSLGGFGAGLAVATLSGLVARATEQREDASFASFYLISLALGVLLVSTRGGNVDLLHVLFGTVLAVDDAALILVTSIASVTLLTLAVIYRPLVVECFDPGFLRAVGGGGGATHLTFLVLVVLNLVGGFQALGTLLAVGLMMLPATAARFWVRELWSMALVAFAIAFASGWLGLVVSFWFNLPSGPAIILAAGVFYLLSLVAGIRGSLLVRLLPGRHRAA
jgi:zinc/manganese transport system permease protein